MAVDDARRRKTLARLVVLFGSATVALSLALAALLLRSTPILAAAPTPAIGKLRLDYDPSYDIFSPVPDPGVGLVYFPGLVDVPAWSTRVPLTTNLAGLRYPEEIRAKPAGTYRVLVMGDSFVAAHAARYEEGVAPQLQALLERVAKKPAGVTRFEVIPVAVSGWNVFAEIRFTLHNLHLLQPDLVIHALNHNDVDGSSGFVTGNRRSSFYDGQGLFGRSQSTVASAQIVLRTDSSIRSLLASYLITESVRRWDQAAAEAEWLAKRLDEDWHAPYVIHCIDPKAFFPVARAFLRFEPADRIVAGAAWTRADTLQPLDGHPNGNGYRLWALTIADHLDRIGILPLDREELERAGPPRAWSTLADTEVTEAANRKIWEVDRIPAGFRMEENDFLPPDGVRCIVAGVYTRCVLSTRSLFVLRRAMDENALVLELSFPAVSALVDRELTVFVDGTRVQAIPMTGAPRIRLALPDASRTRDLIEVALEADGFYTDLANVSINGLFAAAPQAGQLLSIGLETE